VHSPFPSSGAKGIVFWSGDEAAAKGYARRRTEGGLPTFVLDDTLYGRMLVRLLSSTLPWCSELPDAERFCCWWLGVACEGKLPCVDTCPAALETFRLFSASLPRAGHLRHG